MPTTINGRVIWHGVNAQPSYYNNGQVSFGWELMRQHSAIKTVRIEIEPDKLQQAKTWIREAKQQGYEVIATYHKFEALGSNNKSILIAAANWWKVNYKGLGDNFIINLMNEWGDHDITPQQYAACYNEAIAIIRTVYTGQIIIDLPGWGQDTHIAYEAAHPHHPLILDRSIIFSVHIYRSSWNRVTGKFLETGDLDKLAATGKPCIVGEFGTGQSGECDWERCVDHARNLGWTLLGWCWNGDGNGLNMVVPSWNVSPTATSFGKNNYFDLVYKKLTTSLPLANS